jgi:hypothetical protein
MTTTARQSVRSTMYSLLTQFQAAHPTMLYSAFTARPSGLGIETPGAFVGNINEPSIIHTSGVRQRNFSTELVLFDTFAPSNEEQAARLDILVDTLLDWLTANADSIPGAIQAPTSITDGELAIPGPQQTLNYRAISIAIGATVQEGRN